MSLSLSLALSHSLWLTLAHSGSLWLSLALSGALSLSLSLSLSAARSFVGLPNFDIVEVGDATPKNTRDYTPMGAQTKERLTKFFAPHNARLYEMIGRDLGWG